MATGWRFESVRRNRESNPLVTIIDAEGGKPRALIVEDEASSASAMARLLEGKCRVLADIAGNLARARELLGQNRYDLMTLDQTLPDGEGLDLLRELRLTGDSTPVIMVTARDLSSLEDNPLAIGACYYVVKNESMRSRLVKAALLVLERGRAVNL